MHSRRSFLCWTASAALAQKARKGQVILLVGAPGSGKSTQAAYLKKQYGLPTISAEQLIQDDPAMLAQSRSPNIKGITSRSDPALNVLLRKRLAMIDVKNGFALDGYPATKDHVDYLMKLGRELGLAPPIVIQLDIPDEESRRRLLKRGNKDDTPQTIEQLIKDYHREMDFIQLYFPDVSIHKVAGTRKPSQVSKSLKQILDPYLKD